MRKILPFARNQLGSNRTRVRIPPLPIEEQLAIATHLDKKCSNIDDSINKKLEVIERLIKYKKSLIYEAVTGKMEV